MNMQAFFSETKHGREIHSSFAVVLVVYFRYGLLSVTIIAHEHSVKSTDFDFQNGSVSVVIRL